jgi:hypothetical protein
LTPLADLGRSPWQAPLHGVRAAGIGAAGDDAEVAARLLEQHVVDVRDEARELEREIIVKLHVRNGGTRRFSWRL